MNTGTKIVLAVSGGYVLGRTKKMKLALALGLFLAGRKLPKSPLEMVQQGAGALAKNEQVAELTQQVRGSLLDAGKAAAGRSAERWLAGVSDRLREGIPTPDAGAQDKQTEDQPSDDQQAEQQAGQQDGQSQDTQSQDAQSQDTQSQDAQSQDTQSQDAQSQDAQSEDTDRDTGEESHDEESEDTDSDSAQSPSADSGDRSSRQRSSRSSGSKPPAKKSSGGSRSTKGA